VPRWAKVILQYIVAGVGCRVGWTGPASFWKMLVILITIAGVFLLEYKAKIKE